MDQSSSVIPVSMAGSQLPDTHRFEEKVIREYPYPILGPIRPHGLIALETKYQMIDTNCTGRVPLNGRSAPTSPGVDLPQLGFHTGRRQWFDGHNRISVP